MRAARFKSKDVPLGELRETGRILMDSGRKALATLKVDGYALRLETSFADYSVDYHPHIHAVIDSPSAGRGFISAAAFRDEWLNALPGHLHPRESPSHISKVRNVEDAAGYICKSPFAGTAFGSYLAVKQEAIDRTVATIRETKGLHRLSLRGTLAAQCADSLEGGNDN